MSFKANKAKFKLFSKPKDENIKKPKLMPTIAATAMQLAQEKSFQREKREKVIETDHVDATENLDTSVVFSKIFKRGINPIRPEIVLVNEFQPLVTGNFNNNNSNSINLNFGNDKVLEVTNVARLIELQHILRKNAIREANYIIKNHGKAKINENYLIDEMEKSLKPDRQFKKLYSPNIKDFRINLINETKNNIKDITVSNQIKKVDKRYIELLADYVLNKYVAREITLYVARLFDFKEKLEKSLELNAKSIVKPKIQTKPFPGLIKNATSNVKKLLASGRANFPRNASNSLQIATLGGVRSNSKNDLNKSNFENFLNLTTHMISLLYCYDTIDDIENKNFPIKENIVYGREGNLKKSIEKLKKIKLSGCFSEKNVGMPLPESDSIVNESNLDSILSATNSSNNQTANSEILAALCYSQVAKANLNVNKFDQTIKNLQNLNFESIDQLIGSELLLFFDKYSPERAFNDKSFKIFKENKRRLGNIFEALFNKRKYHENLYIPFETNNTIASKLYRDNAEYPGEEVFFTSAIKNGDINFKELKKFLDDIKPMMENVTENIIKTFSLDFDENGEKSDDENTVVNNLNPLSYFNFYLKSLADEIDTGFSNTDMARKNLPGLTLIVNSAGDLSTIADSFCGSLTGAMLRNDISTFWAKTNWVQKSLADRNRGGYSKGGNVYYTLMSESALRCSELYKDIFRELNISDFPNSSLKMGRTGMTNSESSKYIFDGSRKKMSKSGDDKFPRSSRKKSLFAGVSEDTLEITNITDMIKKIKEALADDSNDLPMMTLAYGGNKDVSLNIASKLNIITYNDVEKNYNASNNLSDATLSYLDDKVNSTLGYEDAVGPQITQNGTFMSRVLLDSALGNYTKSAEMKIPKVDSDMSKKINRNENLVFFNNKGGDEKEDWSVNDNPGTFGEVFLTSAVQRSLIFHIFATGLLADTLSIRAFIGSAGTNFALAYKRERIKGLVCALRGQNLQADASESERHAYDQAVERIDLVKSKILKRQDYILRCLSVINDKIDSLETTYKNMLDFVQGNTAGPSFAFVKSKLDENNFMEDTFSLLNPSYRDYLSVTYLKNFCRRENASNYSLFPAYDVYYMNDLKVMYKILSQPGYGFLKKEKFGRKNIYHVGIPLGMMDYLKREAYKETGDVDYLDSSLIVITVHKTNQLSTETKYVPKQYVFDMSKHVLPFYCNYQGDIKIANHVKKMTDDITFKKVINNIEIFTFNEGANFGFKSSGFGKKGIVGNRTSDIENNYENNPGFLEDIILNQATDYYLKLYTSLTTGLEISDSMFPVKAGTSFTGELDSGLASEYKNFALQNLLSKYPQITDSPSRRERFFRAANSINSSFLLSSNNRLKEMLSISCFERVFSILINDRDFLIDSDDGDTIFNTSPKINRSALIQRTQINPFNVSRSTNKKLKNYLKELNENHTSLSGFAIDIGILKKW